ncbi:nucleotide pyrophosphohydrolase [Acidithiobacillus ferrivorans]|uniref:nucleotide pyrophosphohydrolase n=1 Tax=Acidithiobacillus ferrivorans TaxID=160808 RepID=UPI001C07EE6B|nr:nucleotide pyrophosphohydrolase [Acidithiobacillus ferrivorans]MBU2850023.1 nucleotide pyrophosphohydrolase [Acidithiobacillus ferrivorans]
MSAITDEVVQKLLEFREVRDWAQFHTPRNLAASLVIEASELLECFRWARDDELDGIVVRERAHIEDELADVAILLTYLCIDMRVDINSAMKRKIQKNDEKYPVQLARGSAKKYDEF